MVALNYSDIKNVYASGKLEGLSSVGGFIGSSDYASALSNSFTDINISGTGVTGVGGLVGRTTVAGFTIQNSHTLGDVTTTGDQVGGLVGIQTRPANIYNSYATGNMKGASEVDGLVGRLAVIVNNYTSYIANSFATGDIYGVGGGLIGTISAVAFPLYIDNVYVTGNVASGGGLIGSSTVGNGIVYLSNAFATGDVGTVDNPAGSNSGGLIGTANGNHIIDNVYATGDVISNGEKVGGLIGYILINPATKYQTHVILKSWIKLMPGN